MATLVGVSVGFADQGNGRGNGNANGHGHADEVTAQSPQPTPQSPQPTPTAQATPQSTATAGDSGAATDSLEERHGVSGEIVAIQGSGADGVLTIETASGLVVKIKLTAETELRGTGHDDVAFADLEAGVKVNVQGDPTEADGDATIVAHKVMAHLGHGKHD